MLALSADEFKGVLAHELAHLSNADGKSSFRIQRAANLWVSIAKAMEESGLERSRFVWPFLVRYIPKLTGEAYARRRQNELVADSAAARVANPDTFASALLKSSLYELYQGEAFWQELDRRVASADQPPDSALHEIEALCKVKISVEQPEKALERALLLEAVEGVKPALEAFQALRKPYLRAFAPLPVSPAQGQSREGGGLLRIRRELHVHERGGPKGARDNSLER